MNDKLIGIWKIDPNDFKSIDFYGEIVFEFKSNGELILNTFLKEKVQSVFLNYTIRGNIILTDQPSSPNIQETKFKILPNGKLHLNFNDIESTFIRVYSR